MKSLSILVASLSVSSAMAAQPPPEHFAMIGVRNAFRLSPVKPAGSEIPPQPHRPKVSFQGLTTILGRTLVLLTIEPALSSAEFRQTSCVLAQGESRFEIVILEIDTKAGTVRINNLGAEQTLGLRP